MRVDAVVPVGGEPFAVAAAGGRAFIGASRRARPARGIDTRASVPGRLPVNMDVVRVAARHDGGRLFVGGTIDDAVKLARIDVESGRVDTVALKGDECTVDAVRVSPNGRLVYVATTDTSGGTLTVVTPRPPALWRRCPPCRPFVTSWCAVTAVSRTCLAATRSTAALWR